MIAPNHTCPTEYHKQSVPETPGSREPSSSRLHWQTSWGMEVNKGLD